MAVIAFACRVGSTLCAMTTRGTSLYTHPCSVFHRFAEVKSLCGCGSDLGDSVFVGLPSLLREVRVAVSAAGYTIAENGHGGQ